MTLSGEAAPSGEHFENLWELFLVITTLGRWPLLGFCEWGQEG